MAGFIAECRDLIRVDKQVMVALPPKVPGKRGHGLNSQLNSTQVDFIQCFGYFVIKFRTCFNRQKILWRPASGIEYQYRFRCRREILAQLGGYSTVRFNSAMECA